MPRLLNRFLGGLPLRCLPRWPRSVPGSGRVGSLLSRSMLPVCLMLALAAPAPAQDDAAHTQFVFAYKLLQRHEDQAAAQAFDEFLGKFPRDDKVGDARYYRALLHRKAGESQRAADLLRGVTSTTLVPMPTVRLLQGQSLADGKRYDEAVAALSEIDLDKVPADTAASVQYLRGLAYRGAGNLDAAAKALQATADLDSPLAARALLDLARVQVLRDKPGDAIKTLDATVVKAKDLGGEAGIATAAEASTFTGDLYYRAGQYDDAVKAYRRAIADFPSRAHYGPAVLGTLWSKYAAGNYRGVVEGYGDYAAKLPAQDAPTAAYLLGSAYRELGDHQKAADALAQVSPAGGRFPLAEKALYKLAASRYELGDPAGMRRALDELDRWFPKSQLAADAAFLRAAADAKEGDVAKGAAHLTDLIRQGEDAPYYEQALLHRAQLYERNGEAAAAVGDYAAYLKRVEATGQTDSPQARSASLRLSDLAYRLGKFDAAAGVAQRLLKQSKLDAATEQEALFRMALALSRLEGEGRREQALATLDQLQTKHPANAFASEARYYRGLLLLSTAADAESKDDAQKQAMKELSAAGGDENLAKPMRASALRVVALRQREADRAGEAINTLASLEDLVGRDGMDVTERLWLAGELIQSGDAEGTERALRYAAPLAGKDVKLPPAVRAEALYRVGQAERRLGRTREAVAALGEVVSLGTAYDLEARLELGRTLADAGELDQALNELEGLASARPRIAAAALWEMGRAQRTLAERRMQARDEKGALEAIEAARTSFKKLALVYNQPELQPLPQRAHLALAQIESEFNRPAESRRWYADLIEAWPEKDKGDGAYDAYTTFARAMLAAGDGEIAQALNLLKPLRSAGGGEGAKRLDEYLAPRVAAQAELLEKRQR